MGNGAWAYHLIFRKNRFIRFSQEQFGFKFFDQISMRKGIKESFAAMILLGRKYYVED